MPRYQENKNNQKKEGDLEVQVLHTNRVTKVVKGGKKLKFQALVVVGDKKGKYGVALAKGQDPRSAIEKATQKAKKNVKKLELKDGTVNFEVLQKFKAARIFFKPAKPGTGIICSNSIRPILELAGITDIYTKIYGTNNKVTNAYCVAMAFEQLSN